MLVLEPTSPNVSKAEVLPVIQNATSGDPDIDRGSPLTTAVKAGSEISDSSASILAKAPDLLNQMPPQ